MAERLDMDWNLSFDEIREIAAERGIVAASVELDVPVATVMNACADLLDEEPEVHEGVGYCSGCGRMVSNVTTKRCRACRSADLNDKLERVRTLIAMGLTRREVAREMEAHLSQVNEWVAKGRKRGMTFHRPGRRRRG